MLRYESSEHARHLLIASLALALGLANHHLLALVILLPGMVFVFARKQRPTWSMVGLCAGTGTVGLLALAYLPVRSLAHPEVNFGAPHTLERLVWTLRGAAFTKSATMEHVSSPLVDLLQVISALTQALTLPLFFVALAGRRARSAKRNTTASDWLAGWRGAGVHSGPCVARFRS